MDMSYPNNIREIFSVYNAGKPTAFAKIKGGPIAPSIVGDIFLYQLREGVYIKAYISGIPTTTSNGESSSFHGLHIHEFGNCKVGNPQEPFLSAGDHWNPTNQPHPLHSGDLPPILSANGIGILSFYNNRFTVRDALGRAFILHERADDFTSQPAGNAGLRLACGVIVTYNG